MAQLQKKRRSLINNISTEDILGYSIVTENKKACINILKSWITSDQNQKYFVCVNPHSIEKAEIDSKAKQALQSANLVLPDGIGIVLASKILGGHIKERVTGSDIFLGFSKLMNSRKNIRYYFLGSTEGVLLKIQKKLLIDFPNIEISGVYSPPYKDEFTEEDNQKMINEINNSKTDVLWVGMTAPKQEKWIFANKEKLNVKLIGPIGAVFDFYSGKVKRSHPVFQKMGLEWLPRLLQEPRRLWRRNIISNPRFLFRVIAEKWRTI